MFCPQFFSQNRLSVSLLGRCLTEAILTSNLFFKENNKTKVRAQVFMKQLFIQVESMAYLLFYHMLK